MADQVLKVNRRDLEIVFKNPRLVRAIEDLINTTQVLLPDQVLTLTIAIEEAALSADSAGVAALSAHAIAAQALAGVQSLEMLPPPAPVVLPEDAHGRLEALEARVQELTKEIDGLKQGTTP
jgi:hypothetical protein